MDIIQIRNKIESLEAAETTWDNLQRLATLYSVYDHLSGEKTHILASDVVQVMPDCGIGEFEEAVSRKPIYPLIDLLSEHMEVIKTLFPKEYRSLIEQIKNIS